MYMKLLVSMLFAVGVVALATINTALAQSYPDKPIRLIVPYTAAGTTDIVARIIAEPLSQAIGQAVIVENKAGAGGAVGSAELARAAADGYTVGMATVSTMIIIPASNPKLNYSQADFAAITNIAATPNVIAVNANFVAKDGKEFITLLKANPGKYAFATSGKASINHMLGESFQALSGTDLVHVPYRGSGPAINDVIAGQVPILVDQISSSKAFIDAGKLRLMGVIAPKRLTAYPNVPTMEELGLTGFTEQAWYGLVAPAKTPAPVLLKLAEAMKKVMARADVRTKLENAGAIPLGNSAVEYTTQMKLELEAMKKIIAARKINFED
jgi:tripartite-type tricarboxylate transporter receptor subunit TctC